LIVRKRNVPASSGAATPETFDQAARRLADEHVAQDAVKRRKRKLGGHPDAEHETETM
jgi:hypothetical protein